MRRTILLCLLSISTLTLPAQDKPLTWDAFCEDYFQGNEEDEAAEAGLHDMLEALAESPMNLNTATREDLLALPFISEAQADSLLSFRTRKHGFWSRGDLMLVRGMDYTTRRYLSLFTYVGDTPKTKPKLGEMLGRGKHELESRLDVPFYRRAGNRWPKKGEAISNVNRIYLGNGLANVVRYRYRWRENVRYGVTLGKDAGEPFGQQGNYPYDYNSAYFYYKSTNERLAFIAGDYEFSQGQGLILGNGFFTGPAMLLESPRRNVTNFRPHTSGDENSFFRGAAARVKLPRDWSIAAFASCNKADALVENDTVRSLQTTGYHRTPSELNHKDALTVSTFGGHLSLDKLTWSLGVGGYYTHFSMPFSPRPREYNQYYLRGNAAAGLSLGWFLKLRKWTLRGEGAADRRLHLALTQTLRFTPTQELAFVFLHRHFSPRFVSPFGKTFQHASRVANEHGMMLGMLYNGSFFSLKAYADGYICPTSSYLADGRSNGGECLVQGTFRLSRQFSLLLRYKGSARQRNLSGYENILEYSTTHRLRISTTLEKEKWQLHAAADATLSGKQSTENAFGWMLSLRTSYRPSNSLKLGAFAGLFFTDNFTSACYAYEAQLRYAFYIPAFFYHGYHLSCIAQYQFAKWGSLGLRYGITHYFNRSTISSGTQQINSSSKQDISLQAVLHF